ncbi:kinase-like protein [Fusarium austroafricanum]|uniref:Kinase-like protein n=1 Tax=Fusarium austroafricanum TaxID=2364996 RepID=A0A8H4K2Y1_9HYPO|nr:kinase-like protein [Fusarium austroafricanum]
MHSPFVKNNVQVAKSREADSSYGDSVSSARDNGTTELSSLSHRSSPSLAGPCSRDTSLDLPTFQLDIQDGHSSTFEVSGSEYDGSKSGQAEEQDFAITREAFRGQDYDYLRPSSRSGIKREPSEVSDLGNREYNNRKQDYDQAESSDDENDHILQEIPLEDKLLADQHHYRDGRKGFIPRGHISKTINQQGVAKHLHQILTHIPAMKREKTVQEYVRRIFPSNSQRKSFAQIFSILVLTGKSDCIGDFLDEGIDDSALPFERCTSGSKGHSQQVKFRPRKGGRRIKSFDKWNLARKQEFHEWQWAVNAPFFHRTTDGGPRIFALQPSATLPFIRHSSDSKRNHEVEEHHGGFGKVSKRYIHPDHHSLKAAGKENQAFAVKKLNSKSYKEFKQEFDMLAKLGETKHQHLVSLLGAYCHLDNNYLIFDWADSDLSKYWQSHPDPDFDFETVLWVAEQCAGLASGLQQIHRYGSIEQQKCSADPTQPKLYGRHGDIKPENILWFSDPDRPSHRGTLRICDFGVSEFHTMGSRSNRRNSHVALSPYYRPPESELQDGRISRSYDIWTIGCLYLEFLAWLLGGWRLVRTLVIARNPCSASGGYGHGLCFDYPYFDIDDSRTKATVKQVVLDFIQAFHMDSKCSDFVHDFLDIIQNDLLVVETNDASSSKRILCKRLHSLLKGMAQRCKDEPGYAIKANPRAV